MSANDTTTDDYDLNYDRMVVAHGALMTVAWLVVCPAGIAAARFLKHVDVKKDADGKVVEKVTWTWFRMHYLLFSLCFLLNMVSFGLIYVATAEDHFDVEANGAHVGIGLFVWIFVFVQMAFGYLINFLYNPKRTAVPWWDKLHHWFGRGLFLVCVINVPLGIDLYVSGLPADMTVSPWALISFIAWTFLVGAAFIYKDSKRFTNTDGTSGGKH